MSKIVVNASGVSQMPLTIKFLEGQAPGWYWSEDQGLSGGPFSSARSAIEDYKAAFESSKTVLELAREAGVEDEDNFDERFSQ